eukprot:9383633-Lingulodinium_polyedra.AAC.1
MFPVVTSNNSLRSTHPFARPSAVMSLASHQRTACETPTSKSSRTQLKCPSSVFSVGGLRSRLVMDLYTDSASMVSVTSSKVRRVLLLPSTLRA